MAYTRQPIIVGDTVDFTLNAKKDGVIWDITDGTVTLTLKKPDSTILGPYTATVSNGPGGVAHYQVSNSILDESGDWSRQWKVTKSGVELKTRTIRFQVLPSLT